MRKIFVSALLVCLIVLSSCSPELSEVKKYGSLCVSTSSNVRTIEPSYDERHSASYRVHIQSTFSEYSTEIETTDDTCTVENLEAGDYEVYVEGLTAEGKILVSSEKQTVIITNRQTTNATFRLTKYTEGTGTLSLIISIPAVNDTVDGVFFSWRLSSDEGGESLEQRDVSTSFDSVDGKYRCYELNETLSTGSYIITAEMYGNTEGTSEQVGYTYIDAVHIYNGLTSDSSYVWDKDFFPAVATPVIDLESGTYSDGQTVRLTCSDSRAVIRYTLDGTIPTDTSQVYVNPIELRGNTKLRAVAKVEGIADSLIAEADYTVKVDNPQFSLPSNSMVDSDELEITTALSGTKIIYTLDGTGPSLDNGIEYNGPFTIRETLEVRAVAYKDGYDPSDIVSASYYDVSTPTDSGFFTITPTGAISLNFSRADEIPSVIILPNVLNGIEVVEIAKNGFKNVKGFNYISIPDSVTKISDGAFFGCTDIISIDISTYVTDIGASAFSGWTVNQRINDYSGLIKTGTLENCKAKIYATVKAGTQVVGGYTGMDTLYGIYLSNNVTTIADNAFSGCVNLEEFELPTYVTSIGTLAFNECTKIKSITLPAILKTLPQDAFRGWTDEQTIVDTGGILYNTGLSECSAKVYTKTPSGLTEISEDYGEGKDYLYGLEIGSSVKAIGDYAFTGTSIESIVIPNTVETLGLEIFAGWSDEQKVEFVYGGFTASTDGTKTPFTGSNAIYSVSIPSGTVAIENNAFSGMASLTYVIIPTSVKTIGENAFMGTSLGAIDLSSVTGIADSAFMNCSILESVTLASGLKTIGAEAFENCTMLSSITIPDTVTEIGRRAFYNNDALTSVILPDSVTSIGDEILADCGSLLTVDLGGVTSIPKMALYGSDKINSIIARKCLGSLTVTIKVPLEQLIVDEPTAAVIPSYISVVNDEITLEKTSQTIDGVYRVYTFTVSDIIGLYYDIGVILFDSDVNNVGSASRKDVKVTAGKTTSATFEFSMSDIDTTSRTLSAPVINPAGSVYTDGEEITIMAEIGAAVYYTLDGSVPTEINGTLYTSPIVFHELKNLKAVAVKDGYAYSPVASTGYTGIKALPPTSAPDQNDVYPQSQQITLTTVTEGADIYYSLGESTSYVKYTGPFTINESTTVNAYSAKTGFADSDIVNIDYTITVPSHDVETPTVKTLSIETLVGDGVHIFRPVLTPASDSASYQWYLDGEAVSTEKEWKTSEDLMSDMHIIELVAKVDGIPYSAQLFSDEIKLSYRVELKKEEWSRDTAYVNPDPEYYDGVYVAGSTSPLTETMTIYVKGSGEFSVYIRNSESNDSSAFLTAYELDSLEDTFVSTYFIRSDSTDISGYTKVTYTIPDDGKEHYVAIKFFKANTTANRGYVLIPMNQ